MMAIMEAPSVGHSWWQAHLGDVEILRQRKREITPNHLILRCRPDAVGTASKEPPEGAGSNCGACFGARRRRALQHEVDWRTAIADPKSRRAGRPPDLAW